MDIFISKKMRNFILLAQTNNIARAAEKIHMTASPFGKSIAALEEQIGCIDSREVRKKPGGHWIIRDLAGLDLVGLASL